MRILLLSGGLDSALVLWRERLDACLVVDYGQPHHAEIRAARELAALRGVQLHEARATWSTRPTTGLLAGQDLTAAMSVCAGRNAMFIALAAMMGATEVLLGCNADDQADFVDCRDDVLAAVGRACGVTVTLPLAAMTKREILAAAASAGLPIARCMSCYRGTNCGECAACKLRNWSV